MKTRNEITLFEILAQAVEDICREKGYEPGDKGNFARIFWVLAAGRIWDPAGDIWPGTDGYEILYACQLRGMMLPRKFREFFREFRVIENHREEREAAEELIRRLYG